MFSGIVRCADCGEKPYYCTSKNFEARQDYFICATSRLKGNEVCGSHFIRTVKKYLYLTELTPAILNNLVKAVYVHASDKSSGHRVRDVDISYNYIGILPASLLNDLINGTAA